MAYLNSFFLARNIGLLLSLLTMNVLAASDQATRLELAGYVDEQGAISIQYKGDTIDPYFTLQALLLAGENGLDISAYAQQWAIWLVERQKPDSTFDRYCRNGPVWASCKTADADDALLAIWLKFLDTMPKTLEGSPVLHTSYDKSVLALSHLLDPSRGVYMASPVYQYGLFMDNLEVLSYRPQPSNPVKIPTPDVLANDIYTVFWDKNDHRFLVSTQPEQKAMASTFYPDQVAQLFPLLFNFKLLSNDRATYYKNWMQRYRSSWLEQSRADFAWGLVAVVALHQGDRFSASCWLRETTNVQRTWHWIVTDEVARQILVHRGVTSAKESDNCR